MPDITRSYEDGLREGEVKAMKAIIHDHRTRLDNHSRRIGMLEKIAWAMFGIIALIQFVPTIKYLAEAIK